MRCGRAKQYIYVGKQGRDDNMKQFSIHLPLFPPTHIFFRQYTCIMENGVCRGACLLNCFMLSPQPCFPTFCCSVQSEFSGARAFPPVSQYEYHQLIHSWPSLSKPTSFWFT